MTPEVNVTIGGDRLPEVFGGVFAFEKNCEIIFACSGVQTADAYHILLRSRPGAGGEARAPRLADSYHG